jgi:hypothetical protein
LLQFFFFVSKVCFDDDNERLPYQHVETVYQSGNETKVNYERTEKNDKEIGVDDTGTSAAIEGFSLLVENGFTDTDISDNFTCIQLEKEADKIIIGNVNQSET